jgi:plasmid stabilization system protein ParE
MERALDWYAVEAPEQIERFEREIDRAVRRIVAHPLLPAILVASARRMHVEVFPFELWYLVHAHLELIEIVALVHDRQETAGTVARL